MTLSERSLGPFDLFGTPTTVVVDDSLAGRTLREELSIYPASRDAGRRTVRVTHDPPPTGAAENPTTHARLADGFLARYPNAAVRFRFDATGLAETVVHLRRSLRGIGAWRSRWRSIQYAAQDEMAGQVLHELALIPALYFEPGLLPVHASAFNLPGIGMTLVGGTGGVGKTTLALDLCRRHGAEFAADDIAVVDSSAVIHPNLAYPKIYAYNVEGDPDLRDRLLGAAGPADRLQWSWRRARGGPAKVRRRVSPTALYGSVVTEPMALRRYLILVREHRADVSTSAVDGSVAAEMSIAVLQAEYAEWHRHLSWEAFNALALGEAPRLRLQDLTERLHALAGRILGNVECIVARVPIGLAHADLRRALAEVVLNR